jgi:putative transposase
MIEPDNKLSMNKQCELLNFPTSTYYYEPVKKDRRNSFLDIVSAINLKYPFYGYRRLNMEIKRLGYLSCEKKVRNAMNILNIKAIYPEPNLSVPGTEHKKYPYLLNNITLMHPNQVWASDITYVRHKGSFAYLSAIIDLYSRKIMSWKLSNTMDVSICTDVLNEAIYNFGCPEIFNTDQGSQYTSNVFTDLLKGYDIRISMNSKGRALDNVYIERFWRSLKYENIFINDYESIRELTQGIEKYIKFYNTDRFHQSLEYKTPDEVYYENEKQVISL